MADETKPTAGPHALGARGLGYEHVVIKDFDPQTGVGLCSRDGEPDQQFIVIQGSLPKLAPLLNELVGTEEIAALRFKRDGKHVTELRWLSEHRFIDIEPHVRLALDVLTGKVPRSVLGKSPEELTKEALNKAAGDQSVVDLARLRKKIAKNADAAKVVAVPGMPEQKEEGRLNEPLLRYLKAKKIPSAMWPETAAEIERLIVKKLVAAEKRPRWDDRAKYPELQFLPAPEFLRRVWADQIGPNGEVDKTLIRQIDRPLIKTVEAYVSNRQRRNRDRGQVKGLQLLSRGKGPSGVE